MASKTTKAQNIKKSGSGVDAGTQGSLAVVQDAATLDSNSGIQPAAEIALEIFQKIQFVKDHRTSSQKLADDILGLIAKIWKTYQKLPADKKQNWPPKNDIEELVSKLEPFLALVEEQQVKRSKTGRVWNSLTDSDSGKIRERVHGAIRLFEKNHPRINDGVRVEEEKGHTPDVEVRPLTEEKKVRIIEEEPHRLQAERKVRVTDGEARQPRGLSHICDEQAKERLQDPESDRQHKETQREIERLLEVIRALEEQKAAEEKERERKREGKEVVDRIAAKERARQREDTARVEAEEQRRRERIRIVEEDEKQCMFDRRKASEQVEKEAKATRIAGMESIVSEQDESEEESSSDAAEEPPRKLAPQMFLPSLYPGQYLVDVSQWYSPYNGVPTNGSPPITNTISGFNNATIDGEINIGNVTNSNNTKSGESVPRQEQVAVPRQPRQGKRKSRK